MRLYIPATSTLVTQLLNDGELMVERGFAVTAELRQWHRDTSSSDDLEEMEYLAATLAADASLDLLDQDAAAVRRRLVLVVELSSPAGVSLLEGELGEVRIQVPIRRDQIEAALVDGADAQAVDQIDQELMWFAAGELAYIF